MFEFIKDYGNYETRKVGKDSVNGLEISTAYSSDEGYETALIDENGVHPVERYLTKESAIEGHKEWMKKAETIINVLKLGGFGGIVEDKEIQLKRAFKN